MTKEKGKKNIFLNLLKIIFKLLYFIVIAFVCLIAAFLLYYIISSQIHAGDENYKPRISVYTIISPSMTPNINVYDVVVNIRVDDPQEIQVGDVITYKSTAATSEGMTITHRVIQRRQLPDGTFEYMTQGDNNAEPDSIYVTYNNVIGKEIITIPYLGHIQFLLANQKGWLFLLLIPVSIYLIREIFKLIDLLGLRRRVNKVVGTKEESIVEKRKIEKEKQKLLKEQIKEELIINEIKKDALIRNQFEQEGFLEKYKETTIKVKENKYKQFVNTKKEQKEEIEDIVESKQPTKVDIENIIPKEEKDLAIILPKEKVKPEIVNEQYEILDTDELTSKIKEYDSKIEKLDQMLKDIENIKPEEKEEELIEVDDFLVGTKIKVIKIEETKNKRRTKKESTKEGELNKKNQDDNNRRKISRPISQDIKELRKAERQKVLDSTNNKKTSKKSQLKLNPNEVKKINRSSKKKQDTSKEEKKLNLNPNTVKKINRSTKKKEDTKAAKKKPLIVIEKEK